MSKHVTISPEEAADRLAIRELVEAYAHCADRRDAKGQMSLFTADTHFVVYMNAKDPKPSQELHSREALAPVFADLNRYNATMHFVGQSTILSLTSDRATGEAYTLAHHLTIEGGKRRLMIAVLRYSDQFVKIDGERRVNEGLSSKPCDRIHPDARKREGHLGCTKTVPERNVFTCGDLALSEKQVPQVVENIETPKQGMECMEAGGVLAKQMLSQLSDTPV
jgi:SnoaL-like domain